MQSNNNPENVPLCDPEKGLNNNYVQNGGHAWPKKPKSGSYLYSHLSNLWSKLQSCYYMAFHIILRRLVIGLFTCFIPRKRKTIENKIVLITGGSKGLGREIAYKLANKKCKIAIADVDTINGQETVKKLVSLNCHAKLFQCDVSSYPSVEQLRNQIEASLGSVDIVINNAACLFADPIINANAEFLEKFVNINFMSVFWTTKAFLPGMIERKSGHIVTVASLGGLIPLPCEHAYTATKFGIRGFMEALSIDLYMNRQHEFIKTTIVYPTYMNTRTDIKNVADRKIRGSMAKSLLMTDVNLVAERTVEGILKDKPKIYIPKSNACLSRLPFSEKTMKELMRYMFRRDLNNPNRPEGRFVVENENGLQIQNVFVEKPSLRPNIC